MKELSDKKYMLITYEEYKQMEKKHFLKQN